MGHKYVKRDGTWQMLYAYCDTSTIIRTCPVCKFSQPLDRRVLHIVDFKQCPKCHAVLDLPKWVNFIR